MLKVLKFGGSSLADARQFAKVKSIVDADPARRVVIVSAPGKRFSGDHKITDLLYLCAAHIKYGVSCEDIFAMIRDRYNEIIAECGLKLSLDKEFDELWRKMQSGISKDELASRGEYFSARLMAEYLGYEFVDAARWIKFKFDGTVDQDASYAALRSLAEDRKVVIPGFYGVMPDGHIRTFSRGGSDITGALAAAALNADVYENWTDVDGFFAADPSMVFSPRLVPCLSYEQLRILSSLGARVLHSDSVLPVCAKNIPINIRNFYKPHLDGSMIVPVSASGRRICGIVSETVYKYSFSGSFYLPPKASVLFQSVSPKGRICVTKQRLPAGSASCGFKAEQKCLVGAVFHQCADMAEKASRALSQKNIGYEILSCDRTLLLLLTDSSDRVEAVRALNDLV